jgi:hypothetical protein
MKVTANNMANNETAAEEGAQIMENMQSKKANALCLVLFYSFVFSHPILKDGIKVSREQKLEMQREQFYFTPKPYFFAPKSMRTTVIVEKLTFCWVILRWLFLVILHSWLIRFRVRCPIYAKPST